MERFVLVSGAGSGIGRAIAVRLAEKGYGVLLLGRTETTLKETQAMMNDAERHLIAPADVRDAKSVREALLAAGAGVLHGIVACHGIGGENNYGPEDRWGDIIDTNLHGVYYLVNEALPYLKVNRADDGDFRHIVIISSILARLGVPGYTAYCASKAGLLGLARSWAQTFARENILVNTICPGWVNTQMSRDGIEGFATNTGKTYDEALEEQMSSVPLGKMSEPAEVAALVDFLISQEQSSFTGQTIDFNNGALMP